MKKKWESYEEVARYLVNQFRETFGLETVEGKQLVSGKCTEWEIDGKGIRIGNEGFVVIECRRYPKSRLSQEDAAALAFRIEDVGATGGILVSPLGFQEGGKKIAQAKNIESLFLNPDSTIEHYVLRFLNKVMIGVGEAVPLRFAGELATVVISHRADESA
jgi:hypothetical protein